MEHIGMKLSLMAFQNSRLKTSNPDNIPLWNYIQVIHGMSHSLLSLAVFVISKYNRVQVSNCILANTYKYVLAIFGIFYEREQHL